MSGDSVQHQKCLHRMENAVAHNQKIRSLLEGIEKLGCPLPQDFFSCRSCDKAEISGGFIVPGSDAQRHYNPHIILCENKYMEKETFEHTLAHELVHAYDQCRMKMDWHNCLHHACTEIRASALSGECNMLHEIYRGHTKLRGDSRSAWREGQKICKNESQLC